jgi:hypothetical protein
MRRANIGEVSLLELLRHPGLLAALGVASVVLFVLGVLGVPFFLARLPADYFSREERASPPETGPARFLLRIAKNGLGALFVVLGVVMLVLPGQGLLTILVGVLLIDIPGKRRVVRRIIAAPRVLRVVNALRRRWKRPPLEI